MDNRQIRAIMLYEHLLSTNAPKTAEKINTAFGPGTTSERTVRFWFKRFDEGARSCEDVPRSGRPPEFEEVALRQELELHANSSTHDLERTLGYTHTIIDPHLKAMGYRKVLCRWTPHALTDHDKSVRVSICLSLLLHPHRQDFLRKIVTGDESWVRYENSTRRAFWIPFSEEAPAQPKLDLHGFKLMLSVFWDSQGMIYWERFETNQTANANLYAEQLRKLAIAVKTKRPK